MNLFVLSLDADENAEMHCDQHVVKMILEGAQLLSTAVVVHQALCENVGRSLTRDEIKRIHMYWDSMDALKPYKPTHVNHPLTIWTRTSKKNFMFVKSYVHALHNEYQRRYAKMHKSAMVADSLEPPSTMPEGNLPVQPVLCMPEEYKTEGDPVRSYRTFYKEEKMKFAKYAYTPMPSWLVSS